MVLATSVWLISAKISVVSCQIDDLAAVQTA
jgi:hypothetical protein